MLRESGALFARKFHPSSCYFSDWLNVMKLLDTPLLSIPSVSLDATATTPVLTTSAESAASQSQSQSDNASGIVQTQSMIDSSDTHSKSTSVASNDRTSPQELDVSNSGGDKKRARHS